MSIRRPGITKKIGQHRYSLYRDFPTDKREAQEIAAKLKGQGYSSVRLVHLISQPIVL